MTETLLMDIIQAGILRPLPTQACYLTFELKPTADPPTLLHCPESIDIQNNITGIGASLLKFMDCNIAEMTAMPDLTYGNINIPSTPTALWCWLQDDDQGKDLTGYEDGTENPEGEDAQKAAILSDSNPDLDGSSFVAVQLWQNNFDTFESFISQHQDHIIGRRLSDSEKLDDAPESAHVKRTARESYSPEAFMLRRSMPWSKTLNGGLQFVAFGCSFYAFEAQMKRTTGSEDSVIDGLFEFSQPQSGAHYCCPSARECRLNLDALHLQLK
jgi:putative iron-dependent peroxidase